MANPKRARHTSSTLVRWLPSDLHLVEQAARASGETLSNLLRRAALAEAKKVLRGA